MEVIMQGLGLTIKLLHHGDVLWNIAKK
jgi:hypothetical protein